MLTAHMLLRSTSILMRGTPERIYLRPSVKRCQQGYSVNTPPFRPQFRMATTQIDAYQR
jgi:hypothetical protein